MIPSDRANPQVPGVDRRAGQIIGVMFADGLGLAARQHHTHMLVPGPARVGPQGRAGAGYDVAQHIAAATPAGPAGFYARLRAIAPGSSS